MATTFRCHGYEITVDPRNRTVTYRVVDINDLRLTRDCIQKIEQILKQGG